jgi:tRNA-dihydrouridine synthase B
MSQSCLKNAQPHLNMGGLSLRNRALLAPMSGVSDVPFRRLAWEFGAGMVVSEMVASEALTTGQAEMRLKVESAGLPVHIVQLAGREPNWMKQATCLAEQAGASAIDINMGCPSKRVTNGYSGSALMRDLDHAVTLIDAVTGATELPVTLKMRLGWDEHSINAPQLAKRAEQAGVQMITVHGRTRNQFYKGRADWSKVKPVTEQVTVPVIVNGDILDADTARQALLESGASGVMIGRASYGAPWLPGQIGATLDGQETIITPTGQQLADIVARHYEAMLSFYGTELGMRNARKHLDWYCAKITLPEEFRQRRQELLTSRDPGCVLKAISDLFVQAEPARVAA